MPNSKRARVLWGFALVVAVGCGEAAHSNDEATPSTTIQSIQLARRGAFGFCIEDRQFLTAAIATGLNGLPTLSGMVHRGWEDAALTDCEHLMQHQAGGALDACERLEEVGPIQLSGAQQSILEQLTNRLPERECQGAVYPGCDPCLVSNLTVNGVSFTTNPCTADCSDYLDAVGQIEDSIDSFILP